MLAVLLGPGEVFFIVVITAVVVFLIARRKKMRRNEKAPSYYSALVFNIYPPMANPAYLFY